MVFFCWSESCGSHCQYILPANRSINLWFAQGYGVPQGDCLLCCVLYHGFRMPRSKSSMFCEDLWMFTHVHLPSGNQLAGKSHINGCFNRKIIDTWSIFQHLERIWARVCQEAGATVRTFPPRGHRCRVHPPVGFPCCHRRPPSARSQPARAARADTTIRTMATRSSIRCLRTSSRAAYLWERGGNLTRHHGHLRGKRCGGKKTMLDCTGDYLKIISSPVRSSLFQSIPHLPMSYRPGLLRRRNQAAEAAVAGEAAARSTAPSPVSMQRLWCPKTRSQAPRWGWGTAWSRDGTYGTRFWVQL